MKVNTYDKEITDIYDDLVNGGYYDYPQVVKTLGKILGDKKRVLELGIGTGNIAIPLAKKGFQIDGIDPSPFMLDKLREKLKKTTIKMKLYTQGAEELDVKDKYDAAFSFGSPFWIVKIEDKFYVDSYLDSKDEFEQTLARVYGTLNNKGLLIMNIQHHGKSFKLPLKNGMEYHFVIEVKDKNHILKTHYFEREGKPVFNKAYPMFRLTEKEALEMFEKSGFQNIGADSSFSFWVFQKNRLALK